MSLENKRVRCVEGGAGFPGLLGTVEIDHGGVLTIKWDNPPTRDVNPTGPFHGGTWNARRIEVLPDPAPVEVYESRVVGDFFDDVTVESNANEVTGGVEVWVDTPTGTRAAANLRLTPEAAETLASGLVDSAKQARLLGPRHYVVGIPCAITINPDRSVTFDVDLSEVNEWDEAPYGDTQSDEDADLVSAAATILGNHHQFKA